MAKIEFTGMDKYIKQLESVAWASSRVCKAAVYHGADVVANEIRAEIKRLNTTTEELAMRAWLKGKPTYITERQRQGLLDSLGVAPIHERLGTYDTKIGFDGYNDVKTERWPDGQPNAMVARSCAKGSIAMKRQPFINKAVNRVAHKAQYAMEKAANDEIKKVIGGNKNG